MCTYVDNIAIIATGASLGEVNDLSQNQLNETCSSEKSVLVTKGATGEILIQFR